MIGNKRGEVVTVTVLAICIVSLLVGFFARPVANKILPGMLGSDQKIVTTQTVKSEPVWQKNPDGSQMLVQKTDTVYNQNNLPVPLTFSQKIVQFGTVSFILVVGLILLCVMTPVGGILLWAWGKLKSALAAAQAKAVTIQAAHDELSADARLIVQSVDSGLASMDANIKAAGSLADSTTDAIVKANYTAIYKALIDMKLDFTTELSKGQDSTTKLLVAQLKND
jgi:hypothetical protein